MVALRIMLTCADPCLWVTCPHRFSRASGRAILAFCNSMTITGARHTQRAGIRGVCYCSCVVLCTFFTAAALLSEKYVYIFYRQFAHIFMVLYLLCFGIAKLEGITLILCGHMKGIYYSLILHSYSREPRQFVGIEDIDYLKAGCQVILHHGAFNCCNLFYNDHS